MKDHKCDLCPNMGAGRYFLGGSFPIFPTSKKLAIPPEIVWLCSLCRNKIVAEEREEAMNYLRRIVTKEISE